jgi:protein-L-isoaspartate O-methyltransferase
MNPLLLAGTALLTLAASGSEAGDILRIAVGGASSDEILGGGVGLNALCSIYNSRTVVKQVRRKLASISALQSARHLAFALRGELRWRPVTQSRYTEIFTARIDPWNYEITPFEFEKFQAAIELLDGVGNDARFERAWEIGCAEGVLTARLAQICERLSAVDFIPLALERAHLRCQQFSNISFTKWDLKSDPAPGPFDLIVITDVLGSLGGGGIFVELATRWWALSHRAVICCMEIASAIATDAVLRTAGGGVCCFAAPVIFTASSPPTQYWLKLRAGRLRIIC